MKIHYSFKTSLWFFASFLLLGLASCKKDKSKNSSITPAVATPVKLDLYAAGITNHDTTYRSLYMGITKIGSKSTTTYAWIFDTASGGLVVDATDIIPSTMFSNTGFTFTGDSVVVNGITITKQTGTIAYASAKVYGNLAYADVNFGDASRGNVTIKRVPFLLYYKGVDLTTGKTISEPHYFDILGVANLYNFTFANGVNLTSPFVNYTPGNGVTPGFKLPAVSASSYSTDYNLNDIPDALTLGLTSADLTSSGYTMHTISYIHNVGYYPLVTGTVTYGSKSFTTSNIVFDTGTNSENFIDDPSVSGSSTLQNTPISVTTNAGFNLSYTSNTSNGYLTIVENPKAATSVGLTLFCIQFFYNNDFLLNYATPQVGLKVHGS